MTNPTEYPTNQTQRLVAQARAAVLTGRGRAASAEEQARAQHERDLLGALPAALERELVHTATELIRSEPYGSILAPLRARFEHLRARWLGSQTTAVPRLAVPWTDEPATPGPDSPAS